MRREVWLALGAAVLGVGGWLVMRKTEVVTFDDADDQGGNDAPPAGRTVFHRERAYGVHPKLTAFLDWWEREGPFPLVIGDKGGVRTVSDQAALYAQGRTVPGPHAGEPGYPPMGQTVTNATSAQDSAHGHAAALDLYPARLNAAGTAAAALLFDDSLFATIGRLAKAQGLAWGGDWKSFPDRPHVEVPGWQSLPIAGLGTV